MMKVERLLILGVALAACDRTTPVAMTGRVFEQPSDTSGVVGGATVETRDVYAEPFDSTVAEDDGAFSVDVPAGQFFTVMASAEGYTPTSVSGLAAAGPFEAGDGRIWTMPDEQYEALFQTFSACPTVGDEGGVATGQVLLYTGEDTSGGEQYAITNGTVTLYASDGSTMDACYLDTDGTEGSQGTVTGSSGLFAVFGVPEGASSLLLTFIVDGYTYGPYQWPIWVPGDGVAPLYPAYVELD